MDMDDEDRRASALSDFTDALLAGGAPAHSPAGDLDVELAATVRTLHRLGRRPAPIGARARIWERATTDTASRSGRGARSASGRVHPLVPLPGEALLKSVAEPSRPPDAAPNKAASPHRLRRLGAVAATTGLLAATLVVAVLATRLPDRTPTGDANTPLVAGPSTTPATWEGEALLAFLGGPGAGAQTTRSIGPGGEPLSVRLVRYTVPPGGGWVIAAGERYVEWTITEGSLSFQDPANQMEWVTAGGDNLAIPGTSLRNQGRAPATVIEVRVERGLPELPVRGGTRAEVLAGGPVGPMRGELTAIAISMVSTPLIVDTARDGAALVVVAEGDTVFHRDGGAIQTGAPGGTPAPIPASGSGLQLGSGDWVLLSEGAAFHLDPIVADDAVVLVVTVSQNTAVVQEHETFGPFDTPTPAS